MTEQEVLKAKEVAKVLRVSIYTVHNLRRSGRLKGFTLAEGGQWRLTRNELNKFMKGDQ